MAEVPRGARGSTSPRHLFRARWRNVLNLMHFPFNFQSLFQKESAKLFLATLARVFCSNHRGRTNFFSRLCFEAPYVLDFLSLFSCVGVEVQRIR